MLSRLNLDGTFLARHGLDVNFFNELPEDIKEELIFSYLPSEPSQQQQQQPATTVTLQDTPVQDVSSDITPVASAPVIVAPPPANLRRQANIDLVNMADVNLRAEILLQSGEEFLATLTPAMQEEARQLREQNPRVSAFA